MSDLPTGWARCRLGELLAYGSTCKAEPTEIPADGWVLELEDIEKDTSRVLSRATAAERKPKSTKNRFDCGDVLYGKLRPYLNKVVIADKAGYATTEIVPLNANGSADQRYLFYWLKSPEFLNYVSAVSHGINMPRLGTEAGNEAPMILAPLAEQNRIADKLDTLLARIDACRERLDRLPGLIKKFRQAVLEAATNGALSADWREANGTQTWTETTLGALGTVSGGLTKNSKRQQLPMVRPYLRVANVHADRLDLTQVESIGISESEFLKTRLEPNDLLIVEGNGSIEQLGRVAMWRGEVQDCSHQNHLIRWRAGPHALPMFVLYCLMSPRGRSAIVDVASSTTGLHTLSISKVSAIPVVIPRIEEQQEIVRRAAHLLSIAARLEERTTLVKSLIGKLQSAALAKAFRGELVVQDAADEPAQALLDRLKSQSSQNDKPKRGRSAASATPV